MSNTDHQVNQIKVINQLEELVKQNSSLVSAVTPMEDFEQDSRLTLTSVHFPSELLKKTIETEIIQPLKEKFPSIHFYSNDSLHITIKNLRVISDPPSFGDDEISLAKTVFSEVIPRHKHFNVYFYRLLLTQSSIALIGTTDEELDEIIFDLDNELKSAGIPDDKKYANSKHFFCNITLARFSQQVTDDLKELVDDISDNLDIAPYTIDNVNLVSGNAIMHHLQIYGTWDLE